jgi:predicted nucleic acid-binding protein
MILCDTNIFISSFNGRTDTIEQLNIIGLQDIVISSITVMELYQGMGNKIELSQMKKKLKFYDVIQIDNAISVKAIELIDKFRLSHGLMIPDALIAATAVTYQIELYTYNFKDFDFIPNLKLYQVK